MLKATIEARSGYIPRTVPHVSTLIIKIKSTNLKEMIFVMQTYQFRFWLYTYF